MVITTELRSHVASRSGSAATLRALGRLAAAHRALRHPWLEAVAAARFSPLRPVLRSFARDYHTYADGFVSYLELVIDKLDDQRHRRLLARNLEEEMGDLADEDVAALQAAGIDPAWIAGVPHRELFGRFCRVLGLTDRELRRPSAAARQWRQRFAVFLEHASPAAAVGALGLGTENVVKPIYRQLLGGIRRLRGVGPRERVFFDLHCIVDDQHALDLDRVALDLMAEPGGAAELRRGMLAALGMRAAFWDHLAVRDALRCGPGALSGVGR